VNLGEKHPRDLYTVICDAVTRMVETYYAYDGYIYRCIYLASYRRRMVVRSTGQGQQVAPCKNKN